MGLWPNQSCKLVAYLQESREIVDSLFTFLTFFGFNCSISILEGSRGPKQKSDIRGRCLFGFNRSNKTHNLWRIFHNLLDYIFMYKIKLSSPSTLKDSYYEVPQHVFGVDKFLLHHIASFLYSSCFFKFVSFLEFVLLIATSVFIEESPTAMIRNGEFFS